MGALNCVYHRTGFTCRVSWRGTLIGVYLVQRVLLGVDQGDWAILGMYLGERAKLGLYLGWELYIAYISDRV